MGATAAPLAIIRPTFGTSPQDAEARMNLQQMAGQQANLVKALSAMFSGILKHRYIQRCTTLTACPICFSEPLKRAAVTQCGHAFCGPCFLTMNRTTHACALCRAPLLTAEEPEADFVSISP